MRARAISVSGHRAVMTTVSFLGDPVLVAVSTLPGRIDLGEPDAVAELVMTPFPPRQLMLRLRSVPQIHRSASSPPALQRVTLLGGGPLRGDRGTVRS